MTLMGGKMNRRTHLLQSKETDADLKRQPTSHSTPASTSLHRGTRHFLRFSSNKEGTTPTLPILLKLTIGIPLLPSLSFYMETR